MMAQPEPDEFTGVSPMIVDDLAARSSVFRDWIRTVHILRCRFRSIPSLNRTARQDCSAGGGGGVGCASEEPTPLLGSLP